MVFKLVCDASFIFYLLSINFHLQLLWDGIKNHIYGCFSCRCHTWAVNLLDAQIRTNKNH